MRIGRIAGILVAPIRERTMHRYLLTAAIAVAAALGTLGIGVSVAVDAIAQSAPPPDGQNGGHECERKKEEPKTS